MTGRCASTSRSHRANGWSRRCVSPATSASWNAGGAMATSRGNYMNEHENSAFRSAEQSDFAAATVDELAELFRLLELPHALVGGHAVNQYTAPRLSYDLDFVVGGANGAA